MKGDDDYDFSDYQFNHPNFSTKNKKVIGKFKDELNDMFVDEFTGLRSKCYSISHIGKVKDNVVKHMDPAQFQKAKGTKKDHLSHNDYNNCLTSLKTIYVSQNIIRSKKHNPKNYHLTKAALTAFDIKRWILDDNINTLAHGHYKTRV